MEKLAKRAMALLFIVFLVAGVWAYMEYENNELVVTTYNIINSKIPKSFDDYKIIQISDYHNATSSTLNTKLIKAIKREDPDLIVITGDLIDARRTDLEQAMNLIRSINFIAPIYYVNGNHEADSKDYSTLRSQMETNGVKVLENKMTNITIGDDKIILIGVDDPLMSYNSSIDKTISNMARDKKTFTILLSHRPEYLDTYSKNEIDLVLTGHAHGGQMRIFNQGIYAPGQGLFPKYTSGVIVKNSTSMVVSRGIGNSMFPLRVNNKPELVSVNLYSK